MGNIAIAKDEIVFVAPETTFGTPVYPTGAQAVLVTGDASFKQARQFSDDRQKRMTVSKLARIAGAYNEGEFSIPCYVKPVSAGVAPRCGALLKALFGKETIVGATSVTYGLGLIDDAVPGLTIVHKKGHLVTFNFGCIVDKGSFPIKAGTGDDAIGQATFTGKFLRQKIAGRSTVNYPTGYTAGATSIVIDDAYQFESEAKVAFYNETTGAVVDDNSGTGFTLSAVDNSTMTLTLSTGLINAVADARVVRGFVPTATEAGTIVHGRFGSAQERKGVVAYADIVIVDALFEVTNNFKILNDEKTGDFYPISAIKAANRAVDVTINKIFKYGDAMYFAECKSQVTRSFKCPVGSTAGARYRFEVPTIDFDTPELSGSEEITIGRKGVALASASYDDEISLVFD